MPRPPAGEVRRCAVLGKPVAHSLSPVLHTAAYRHLDLPWEYGRHEVDEAGLAPFVAGVDATWRGLSLTMPLKGAALGCVHEVSEVAAAVRAVNTIVFGPDGSRGGHNTDVPGMVAALRERGVDRVPSAALLGGGATARSALASLASVTGDVDVYVRTPARAAELLPLADRLGIACRARHWSARAAALQAPLVVVTTPAGAADDLSPDVPARAGVLLDVVYVPWPTPLAAAWQRAGGDVVGGLDLLVHQAVLQVLLMTGRDVPVAVLRQAGRQVLRSPGPVRRTAGQTP